VQLPGLLAGKRGRWQAATDAMRTGLRAARLPVTPATYDAAELDGLPPPVQRYFRRALKDGQPMIESIVSFQWMLKSFRSASGVRASVLMMHEILVEFRTPAIQ
jgi:hypothetical protein